jgi:hypothetical protein
MEGGVVVVLYAMATVDVVAHMPSKRTIRGMKPQSRRNILSLEFELSISWE